MVKVLLAFSLLVWCLAVGCSGTDRHHHSDSVHRPKADHIDKGQQRKPVEVYLKLSDNPQLFVAKKSEAGFLFTTNRPGTPDGKTCEQCVFRFVCKGPDCAEVCELCGKSSGANFDSGPCSGSREIEHVTRNPKRRGQSTTVSSSTRQQDTVTTSSIKPGRLSDKDVSETTKSDEHVGPVRKWINARREYRRKQLEQRNKTRFEGRKLNGARKRTEIEAKDESKTSNETKTSKQSEEKDEKAKATTKSTIASKNSKESTKSLEHFTVESSETHENDVVFHIPKRKDSIRDDQHEEPAKSEKRVKIDEEELSENTKMLKLLEQIIKQKEMEKKMAEGKKMQEIDKSKDDKHTMEKVETTTKRQKHAELDSKDTKPSHTHAPKVGDHHEKENTKHTFDDSDESDWDPLVKDNLVKSEKKEERDGWPYLIGKLIQTEIESAHLLIKHKPLKSALKNLKERFKPIFIATSKALANVFGVQTVDDETIAAKKDKDDEQKSSPTILAPSSTVTATTITTSRVDDTHLSKSTAVKTDTHRRRAFVYSARRKERQRSRRPLSLRATVKKKLREMESLDKLGSSEHGKGCSCKCLASRRR